MHRADRFALAIALPLACLVLTACAARVSTPTAQAPTPEASQPTALAAPSPAEAAGLARVKASPTYRSEMNARIVREQSQWIRPGHGSGLLFVVEIADHGRRVQLIFEKRTGDLVGVAISGGPQQQVFDRLPSTFTDPLAAYQAVSGGK